MRQFIRELMGGSTAFLSNVYGPGTRTGTGLVQGQHEECLQALTQGASGFTCKLRQGKLVSFLQGQASVLLSCLGNMHHKAAQRSDQASGACFIQVVPSWKNVMMTEN